MSNVQAFFCNQAVTAVIQLLGLPIFLSIWGAEVYGEWLVLSAVTSGIAMSDIGIASAAANAMTFHVGAGNRELAKQTSENAWLLLTVLTSLVSLIVLVVVWCTPMVLWLGYHSLSSEAVRWTISALVIQTFISMQTLMLYARLRSIGKLAATVNLATAERLIEFLVQIAAVVVFRSILAAAVAGLIVRVLEYVVTWYIQKAVVPWFASSWFNIRFEIDRKLIRPALANMAFPFGQVLSNQAILALIGSQLGTSAVTVFAAHRTLANAALQVVQSISHAMLPEFSLAFGAGDQLLARRLHRRACQLSLGLGLASCILIGLTAAPILHVYTMGKVPYDHMLMLALLGCVAWRSLWYASLFVSMSINLHHRIAFVFVVGTFASLFLAFPLTSMAGLVGTTVALMLTDTLMLFIVLRTSLDLVGDSASSFIGNMTSYGS